MKILASARFPKEILSLLAEQHDLETHDQNRPMTRQELLQAIEDKEGLMCTIYDRIDEELLARAPKLRMIATYSVGFDHIDVATATRRGIMVSNTPDVLTDATAELAFALLLAVTRRLVEGDHVTRSGAFSTWAPMLFLGHDATGKTLGIIGMGRIGQAMARQAAGFNMRILYYNRTRLSPGEEATLKITYVSFETLLRESDFVSLHVALTPQTRHLIGPREFDLMKPSACLINTARGAVVDEKALVNALKTGQIRGAGLDVYEEEPLLSPGLAELANVVLLPHVGSATVETRLRMGFMAACNLLAGLRGNRPQNCLNQEVLP